MAKISQYIVKDIPYDIGHPCMGGDKEHEQFKSALSDYLDEEYSNGFLLVGIDFKFNIAIFRSFLFGSWGDKGTYEHLEKGE